MHAEVISIGDELTSGQRLDTNSQWLSQRLVELGVRVLYHTTVGDDLTANTLVFREAFERADLIVATGGLGPTADDLTREALAAATGTDLIQDQAAVAHIRGLFARRKREMPERNLVQALFPRGSRIIPNPHGTAPGIDMDIPRSGRAAARVFALPGVPAEMREMWEQTVAPQILIMLGDARRVIRSRTLRCFGVGESDLEAMLPDLIRRGREPTVGITVSNATISLRIVAEANSEPECLRQIESTVQTIHQCLGDLVFGEGEEELAHAVVKLLCQRGATLAIAEGNTGGLLAHWLSEADERYRVFLGGIVRVANAASAEEETRRMAEDCRGMFGALYGLALTYPPAEPGVAEPGTLHVAISSPAGPLATRYPISGHPEILKPRALKQALNFLRLKLGREAVGCRP